MKKLWKTLVNVVLVLVMIMNLVGCGGAKSNNLVETKSESSSADNAQNNSDNSDEKINLRFSWWGSDTRHEATLKVIDMYMEKHPNVVIEGEYGAFDSFYQKLLSQLGGRTEPDIVSVDYKWVSDLINQGDLFVNMNDLSDKIDMSGFDMDFASIYGGQDDYLVGLPVGINGMGYLYNKEFLDEFGIEANNKWTWDTVIENGKKVQAKDSSKYLLYNNSEHWVYLIKTMLKQKTGNPLVKGDYSLGFTLEDMTEVFEYILQLVETKTVPPFEEGVLYETVYADQNPDWLNQTFGVFPTSSSLVPGIAAVSEFELSTLRYPIAENMKDPGILVTPSVFLTISKNSKHADVAADFINFMLNDPEAISVLKDTRGIPANETAKQQLVEEGVIDEKVSAMVSQALTGAGVAETGPSLNTEVIALFKDYVQQLGYKKMTPDHAAEELIVELEKIVEMLK